MLGKRLCFATLALSTVCGCVAYSRPDLQSLGHATRCETRLPSLRVFPAVGAFRKAEGHQVTVTDEEYASRLAKELAYMDMFSEVRTWEADAKAGEWTAIPQLPPDPCSESGGCLNVFSLGIIPRITCIQTGRRFVVRGQGLDGPLEIDSTRKVTVVVGWLAAFLNLTAGWSQDYPRDVELIELRKALEEKLGPLCERQQGQVNALGKTQRESTQTCLASSRAGACGVRLQRQGEQDGLRDTRH